MLFEWDDKKCALNIAKHKLDFIDAQKIFDGRARFDIASPRGEEARFASVAMLRDRLVTVVWTVRGAERIRIISARGARDAEKRQYRHLYG